MIESVHQDDDDGPEDQEPAIQERSWKAVSAETSIVVEEGNKQAIAKFTESENIASTLIRSTFPAFARAVEDPDVAADTPICIIKAASFAASEYGADDEERMQLRGDPDFRGSPWHDGVVVLQPHDNPGRVRDENRNQPCREASIRSVAVHVRTEGGSLAGR